MDIDVVVKMTSRAWNLPILKAFYDGVPGRQAPLLAATGAGRTAFAQSLDHLIQNGLIERNPGYGHPLRPEFRLTEAGVKAAEIAHKIRSADRKDGDPLIRRSWTIPVLATLQTPLQFSGIKRQLGPITDRALSQSLKALEERTWVKRNLIPELRPPRPIYAASGTGKRIADVFELDR